MNANTVTLDRALAETRTGDIWLFRGGSGPDRAIQTMTNAPVNHVGMTVAIDDLPPLIWHAELGDKLESTCGAAATTAACNSTTCVRPSSGGSAPTASGAGCGS